MDKRDEVVRQWWWQSVWFHVGLLDSGVPFSADLLDKPVG